MNIFSDRHHAGLAYSLHLLFEKRLGANLYFPIGMEWAEQGWWHIHKPYNYSPDTAKQYLQIKPEYIPMDGTVPLNRITNEYPSHYEAEDMSNHYLQKCITLEQFKEMPIDVIIASVPDHLKPFTKLRDTYKPNAKVVFQMGNRFTEIINNLHEVPNLLSSTVEIPVPSSCNAVFYHQEFDLNIFKPSSLPTEKLLTSFVNCLSQTGKGYLYNMLKAEMPEYEFRSYGITCDDGIVSEIDRIATIMQRSMFGVHIKSGADGYGHVLHNFFACGKPVIINYEEYKRELGGKLLIPDETCLTTDSDSDIPRVAEKIKTMPPHKYQWMCQRAYQQFQTVVNFDEEEKSIRLWLQNLR